MSLKECPKQPEGCKGLCEIYFVLVSGKIKNHVKKETGCTHSGLKVIQVSTLVKSSITKHLKCQATVVSMSSQMGQ